MAFDTGILRFEPDPKKQEQKMQEAASIHETVLGRLTGMSKRAKVLRGITERLREETAVLVRKKKKNVKAIEHEHGVMNPDKRVLMHEKTRLYRKYGPHRRERANEKFAEYKEHYLRDSIRQLRKDRDARIRAERERLNTMAKGEMQDRGEKARFLSHLTNWSPQSSGPRNRGMSRRAA